MRKPITIVLLFSFLWLGACSKAPTPVTESVGASTTAEQPSAALEVDWFRGGLEEAFAAASAEDKPLFVYWGAEWCPYCKHLQATIFVREEFVRMSRQFIALDMSNGDSETIRHADRFNIYGLPTVILFASDGTELTRVPGGMDMEQYEAALQLTLDNLRPVTELLADAKAGKPLTDEDWRLLGNYSWRSDQARMQDEDDPAALLAQLASDCPKGLPMACSRLQLSATGLWLSSEAASRDPATSAQHLEGFTSILMDPILRSAHVVTLADLGADVVDELASGQQQIELRDALQKYLEESAINDQLNLLHRASILSGWAGVVTALLEEDQTPPSEQVAWGKQAADGMMAELSPYQVHAGINQLWGVYYELGLEEDARAALTRGINESKTPFYFMSGMAYLERQAGNDDAALEWYRKAWESAKEPMHRARWGGGYIRRLLDMAPGEYAEVERSVLLWLAELAEQPYGFEVYSRSLERLESSLQEWSREVPARQEVLARLQSEMTAHCASLLSTGTSVDACERYM